MKHRAQLSLVLAAAIMAVSGIATRSLAAAGSDWQTLIKGATGIENFNLVGAGNWAAQDGAIQASAGPSEGAFLVTKASYADFMIKAEFWASDDANSGIFIRCANPAKIAADSCYEVNVYDKRPDPSYGTGAIVNVAKVDPMPKAGGQWNTMEITAQGSHLVVLLNGKKTVDVQDSKLASGPFALQWGAGVVKFRSVQVKRL